MSLQGEDYAWKNIRVGAGSRGRTARICGYESIMPHRSPRCAGPPDGTETYLCTLPPHGERSAHVMVPFVMGGTLYRLADDNVVRLAPDGSMYRSRPGQPFRARVRGVAGERAPLANLLAEPPVPRGTVTIGVDPAAPGGISVVAHQATPGDVMSSLIEVVAPERPGQVADESAPRTVGGPPGSALNDESTAAVPGTYGALMREQIAREEGREAGVLEGRDIARRELADELAVVRRRFGSLFAGQVVPDDPAERDREYDAAEAVEAARTPREQIWNLAQGAAVHAEAQVFEALTLHARTHNVAEPSGSVEQRVLQVVQQTIDDGRVRRVEDMHLTIDRAFTRAGVPSGVQRVRTCSTAVRLDQLVRVGEARGQRAGDDGLAVRSLASLARRAVPGRNWDDEPVARMVEAIETRLRRTAHVDRTAVDVDTGDAGRTGAAYGTLRAGLLSIFHKAAPDATDTVLLQWARTAYHNSIMLAGRAAAPPTGEVVESHDLHQARAAYADLRAGLIDALGHEGPAEDALLIDKVRVGRRNLTFLLTQPGQPLATEDRPGDVDQAVADSPLTHHYRERMRAVLVALAESGADPCLQMISVADATVLAERDAEHGVGDFAPVTEVALPLALDRAVARSIERAGQGTRAHARAERYRTRLDAIRACLDQLAPDVREFARTDGRIDLQVSRALDYLSDLAGQARPVRDAGPATMPDLRTHAGRLAYDRYLIDGPPLRRGDPCPVCGTRMTVRVADGVDWSSPTVRGVITCPRGCTEESPADSLRRMAGQMADLLAGQDHPGVRAPHPDPKHWTNDLLYGATPWRSLVDLASAMPGQTPDEAVRALRRFTATLAQVFGSTDVVVGQALMNAAEVAGLPWCAVLARRSPQGQVRDVAVAVREPGNGFGRPGEPSRRWWTSERGELLTSGELFERALPMRWVVVAAPTVDWPGRERA